MSSPLISDPASGGVRGVSTVPSFRALKTCRGCGHPAICEGLSFVNCVQCRLKNRDKERQKRANAQKKRLDDIRRLQVLDGYVSSGERTSVQAKIKQKRRERSKEVVPMVRTPLKDLDGEKQRIALMMMKEYIRVPASHQHITRKRRPSHLKGTEYQNATDLYNALKSAVLTAKCICFQGYYSVICKDGMSDLGHAARALVDLRMIAKVSFEDQRPIAIDSPTSNAAFTCVCACRGYKPVLSTELQPKKKASNLLSWATSSKRESAKNESKVRKECHGTVFITVEDDARHIHGIPGHLIHIAIDHPKPTTTV